MTCTLFMREYESVPLYSHNSSEQTKPRVSFQFSWRIYDPVYRAWQTNIAAYIWDKTRNNRAWCRAPRKLHSAAIYQQIRCFLWLQCWRQNHNWSFLASGRYLRALHSLDNFQNSARNRQTSQPTRFCLYKHTLPPQFSCASNDSMAAYAFNGIHISGQDIDELPPRKDIEDFFDDEKQTFLFINALQYIQGLPAKEALSYFQLAGESEVNLDWYLYFLTHIFGL